MRVIRIGFIVITVAWMSFTAYVLVRIAEDLSYLSGSSDYQIQLLDQIAGNVEPLMQLQGLNRNRSFSCSINTPRILDI
tara:strand:- start:298 stop:534 length:237 start_codon:yes stop_codon:yes gene_type:complete